MKDVRAISFAVSLKAQLTDYSKIAVQHLNLKAISLKKLYILLKEEEIEQHSSKEHSHKQAYPLLLQKL